MARVRVHQHVNPLAKYYRELPTQAIDLESRFANTELPLHLDIGCGRGRFLLEMAKSSNDWNFLGTEIREPLVIEANSIKEKNNLNNLHYEFCNATISTDTLLCEIPTDQLKMVTIQFPDPWFKNKHAKRRMVNKQLVSAIASNLASGGQLFIQTDVEFLATEMFDLFSENAEFIQTPIEDSVLSVKTEREKSVENRNLPIYRALFSLNRAQKVNE